MRLLVDKLKSSGFSAGSRPVSLEFTAIFSAQSRRGLIRNPRRARPDLDNVLKLVLEALQKSGVVEDDSQVARIVANKVDAGRGVPSHMVITVCLM